MHEFEKLAFSTSCGSLKLIDNVSVKFMINKHAPVTNETTSACFDVKYFERHFFILTLNERSIVMHVFKNNIIFEFIYLNECKHFNKLTKNHDEH